MPRRDRLDAGPGLFRLGDNPQLLRGAPAAPPLLARDDLDRSA